MELERRQNLSVSENGMSRTRDKFLVLRMERFIAQLTLRSCASDFANQVNAGRRDVARNAITFNTIFARKR